MIQRTIREELADCTLITVAHRLNTVLQYDKYVGLFLTVTRFLNPPHPLHFILVHSFHIPRQIHHACHHSSSYIHCRHFSLHNCSLRSSVILRPNLFPHVIWLSHFFAALAVSVVAILIATSRVPVGGNHQCV